MLVAGVVLGGLMGCAADEADVPEEGAPAVQLLKQYPFAQVWGRWQYYDDVGYRVRAFEALNEDGVVDLQFVSTMTQPYQRTAKLSSIVWTCSDGNATKQTRSSQPGTVLKLGRSPSYGTDMLGVAHCNPGFRPTAVSVLLEID
jgi:hypothetical protein